VLTQKSRYKSCSPPKEYTVQTPQRIILPSSRTFRRGSQSTSQKLLTKLRGPAAREPLCPSGPPGQGHSPGEQTRSGALRELSPAGCLASTEERNRCQAAAARSAPPRRGQRLPEARAERAAPSAQPTEVEARGGEAEPCAPLAGLQTPEPELAAQQHRVTPLRTKSPFPRCRGSRGRVPGSAARQGLGVALLINYFVFEEDFLQSLVHLFAVPSDFHNARCFFSSL